MGIQKIKIIEKYNDSLSAVYDRATLGEFKWTAPAAANDIVLPYVKAGSTVLDVGIGTGQSAEELLKKGCKICGIDISQKMLEATKKKFPNFELYKAALENGLPELAGRSFDLITAIGILEFVEDIDKTIGVLTGFLKPSALLCFTFEEYLPKHKIQRWKKSEIGRGIVDPLPELLTFLNYRHTPTEIKILLANHRLKLLKTKRFQAYLKSKEKIPIYYTIMLARKVDAL